MARMLSLAAIERRIRVAYHRAQGLARNKEYQGDVNRLQTGWCVDGVRIRGLGFDRQSGQLDEPPVGHTVMLVKKICERSGLNVPMLPRSLRALSLRALRDPGNDLFEDVPGWSWERKKRVKPPEGRAPRASTTRPPSKPIDFKDYVPLEMTYEEIVEKVGKPNPEDLSGTMQNDHGFRRVSVPLRRLSERHRGLKDGYADCWRVFDLNSKGLSERQIAQRLWPARLGVSATAARQMVYDHLQTARRLIEASYAASPPGRGKRQSRRLPPTRD